MWTYFMLLFIFIELSLHFGGINIPKWMKSFLATCWMSDIQSQTELPEYWKWTNPKLLWKIYLLLYSKQKKISSSFWAGAVYRVIVIWDSFKQEIALE